ncbi:MAG: LCP family protein [Acetatifactor sp.]|nr:LCP family protein [Acetatifactor sp.]
MLRFKLTKHRQTGHQISVKKRVLYTVIAWVWVMALALGVIFVGILLFLGHGKRNLYKKTTEKAPEIVMDQTSAGETTAAPGEGDIPDRVWEDDWISYDGKVYEYNENILTFLILGIDKDGVVTPAKDKTDGGQSDGIFLIVANPDTGEASIVGVNRDTMVDVYMLGVGEGGTDLVAPAEIAVQHGFGDGMEESCELTRDAVSKLFYGLPIHGYVSFNIGGVKKLNDALGGVDVTIPTDYTKYNSKWKEGEVIHLSGQEAVDYIRKRDMTEFESARDRLSRQKQYLSAFVQKAIAGTREDITLPLALYKSFAPYIVTDITVDEISYLATQMVNYHFDSEAIYTLEGETRMGEQFEEFYPDKEALQRLMIELFYKEVVLE